jgi:pyruvate dehydrogenase E1 component alpha subunit
VDGNDLIAVLRIAREAVERARQGEGPILIEAKTMRMLGHAQHDPAEYVPREMFDYWKARDPLELWRTHLTNNALWEADAPAAIDARIERELAEELAAAESSPMPRPETAAQGVYCEGCHEVHARWLRPVSEVSPPNAATRARWTIQDFGG